MSLVYGRPTGKVTEIFGEFRFPNPGEKRKTETEANIGVARQLKGKSRNWESPVRSRRVAG
jgi:hypothetical protein